jgi:hypothetical protein
MAVQAGRPRALALIERIAAACVESTGVDGTGVSLVTTEGGNRGIVSCTNDIAGKLEELQLSLGHGPCVDAATTGNPVLLEDLQDVGEGVSLRWPAFLSEAAGMGVRSVFALPLGIGAIALGTMDLYRSTPGPLQAAQLSAALLAADSMAVALLGLNEGHTRLDDDDSDWSPHLVVIHQAAGMMRVQLGVHIQEALIRLRATAFAEQRSINELAGDVVADRRRFTKEDA